MFNNLVHFYCKNTRLFFREIRIELIKTNLEAGIVITIYTYEWRMQKKCVSQASLIQPGQNIIQIDGRNLFSVLFVPVPVATQIFHIAPHSNGQCPCNTVSLSRKAKKEVMQAKFKVFCIPNQRRCCKNLFKCSFRIESRTLSIIPRSFYFYFSAIFRSLSLSPASQPPAIGKTVKDNFSSSFPLYQTARQPASQTRGCWELNRIRRQHARSACMYLGWQKGRKEEVCMFFARTHSLTAKPTYPQTTAPSTAATTAKPKLLATSCYVEAIAQTIT